LKAFKFAFIASLFAGSTAMATTKICFGAKSDSNTVGAVLEIVLSKKDIHIRNVKGEFYQNGTYEAYGSTSTGKDGKIYLDFRGVAVDAQDVIMVEDVLFRKGTVGLMKIRARDPETFYQSTWVCRDPKPRS
jgi:hypothetical protein